jgi:hypothetical protein
MATRDEHTQSTSARDRLWLWVRRVLVAFVGLIVLLLLVGFVYQFLATRLAYRNYPAPGEMVSVSGHDMHIYCTGKAGGGPTVVMDAGLGGGVLDWQTVQPKVASFSRVCSYDRSGIGWSESGPKPRTSRQTDQRVRGEPSRPLGEQQARRGEEQRPLHPVRPSRARRRCHPPSRGRGAGRRPAVIEKRPPPWTPIHRSAWK